MESDQRIPSTAPEIVLIPKDYMLGPVFASRPQTVARRVLIGKKIYQIGGFHPFRPTFKPNALDIRHGRALVVLLSFRETLDPKQLVRFSLNEFAKRYAATNGGRYARDLKVLLADWADTFIKITNSETGESHSYRAIERVDVVTKQARKRDARLASDTQEEFWLNGATLSPEFSGLLSQLDELQHIKMEALLSITSPLAQSIYWYIPSRAVHHSESEPFEITLTNLLTQVAHAVPKQKSVRKQLFTQNANSVLAQLDGKETLTGVFRVRLAETSDKGDWKLQAWVDREGQGSTKKALPKPKSKLLEAFLSAGHTQHEMSERLDRISPLTDYEKELLERGEIQVSKNVRFFELAKALLGETNFDSLLSEAKGEELEGRKAKKTQTHRLIYRIMEAVSHK